MEQLWESIESKLRFLLAIPLAFLPRRLWADLDDLAPVTRAAAASGLLTFVVAIAIFVPAYFAFVHGESEAAVEAMLQATGWRDPRAASASAVGGAGVQWSMTYLSLFTFSMTPIGLFALYFGLTGWIRVISVWVDDARGDPLLTLIDRILFRSWVKRTATRARQAREALEGAEVADRVMSGAQAGIADAEIVVVASRRKPDWVKGAFIITEEKWYRLGNPVERHTPNGLRTLYPLTELTDHEVLRKGIQYKIHP